MLIQKYGGTSLADIQGFVAAITGEHADGNFAVHHPDLFQKGDTVFLACSKVDIKENNFGFQGDLLQCCTGTGCGDYRYPKGGKLPLNQPQNCSIIIYH